MPLKGLIFDFDGLILDTETAMCKSWQEQYSAHNLPFTHEDWKKAIGTGPSAYDPGLYLSQLLDFSLNPEQIQENVYSYAWEILSEEPMLPGVHKFIQDAKTVGLTLAIASSSPSFWVIENLTRLGILDYFDFICTSDDVSEVKPNPELYLLALKKTRLLASQVVVFEDSPNGIAAAKAAGIYCIAVPNTITRTMDLSKADRICNSFLDISLDDFSRF